MVRHRILCPSISPNLGVSWQDCSREDAHYEIFRKDLLGTPVWMESVQDLETATLRMDEFVSRSPGQYFIKCQETGAIVRETATRFAISVPAPATRS